jgi:hypothetical protein
LSIISKFLGISALGLSTSGCVVVGVVPVEIETGHTTTTRVIAPTASGKFQACAETALDRHSGAGTPSVSQANEVSQNGYTLTQNAQGGVRVHSPSVPDSQLPAVSAAASRMLESVMACKR